jgi:hypothetical protein
MKSASTVVLALAAAAAGVAAHPSRHHAHMHAHRSLDARGNFVMAKKPVIQVETTVVAPEPTTTSVAPAPATTEASKPKPSSGSGSGSGSGNAEYVPFCSGASKRATDAEVAYVGNVGSGASYGCNMMMVDNSIADMYDYRSVFTNVGGSNQACSCWLKIDANGDISGFTKGHQVLDFTLAPGETKTMVADANTQGSCACQANEIDTTIYGAFGSSWYEFDAENTSNEGWSGADASCILSAKFNMFIPGMKICSETSESPCSIIYPGGTGDNAFLGGDEYKDGLGINQTPGPWTFEISIDYSG